MDPQKPADDILDDKFFESIDEDIGDLDLQSLGIESPKKEVKEEVVKVEGKIQEELKAIKEEVKKLSSAALPAIKLNKEITMQKKQLDSLGLDSSDPNTAQIKGIWDEMNTPSASDFKLMVLRMEPQLIKGQKINGYLETFHLPTTIPDIIEQIGQKYGGGKFQIKIVDGTGKYVKSKTFEISGMPKIPSVTPDVVTTKPDESVATPTPTPTPAPGPKKEADEDYDDYDYDYPRRRLRPSGYDRPYSSPYSSPYNSYASPYGDVYNNNSDNNQSAELESKLMSKVDDKLSRIEQSLTNKPPSSMLNSDLVKAMAPVMIAWMDNRSNQTANSSGQFTEMNKQIVSLMQGMQDLVRIGDKNREDSSEKERREREANRQSTVQHLSKTEERFLEQQRLADDRHQQMMLQMKESLEKNQGQVFERERAFRLELEKSREEVRKSEELARRETREREERLREEIRKREEDNRRREQDQQERRSQEERKWKEDLRLREDEARRRELEWREESRLKEVEALNNIKLKEMEIMNQMRESESQKTDVQHKLLDQVYQNNLGSRESQLQLELAIAKMNSDSESKMLQANAQMELEKIRHATQMQMSKMKHELSATEDKEDDPFSGAMQKYLQRKLQVDMIKELNMESEDGGISTNSILSLVKSLLTDGGPALLQLLSGKTNTVTPAARGRLVNPSPVPQPGPSMPPPPPPPAPQTEAVYED